jgi:hypothetical protein
VEERLVDLGATLIAQAESAELVEPGERALDDPAHGAEARTVVGTSAREDGADVAGAQCLAVRLRVVTSISVHGLRTLARMSGLPAHGRHRIDEGKQLRDVVGVRSGQRDRERDAAAVGQKMVLAPRLGAIGGIRTRLRPPKTARTEELSATARDQSIRPAAWSRARRTSWRRCHTPAPCQSRSRRQQVTPDPHPISCGRSSQPIPVFNTNKIPVSARRLSTGFRPGYRKRRRFGGGSSGSTTSQSSSGSSGCDMRFLRRIAAIYPC